MNCCKKDDHIKETTEVSENQTIPGRRSDRKTKGHMSHMWMMALCCGLPFVLIFALPLFGISFASGSVLQGIIPFLCPLMMVLMIPMMMRGNRCSQEQPNNSEKRSIESKE